MGKMIEFPRPDGQNVPGWLAEPAAGGAGAPGVVVIQEWWGLNPQIKGVADQLAGHGYRALVPDLYRGKVTKDADEASHAMGALDFAAAAGQDVRGAAQWLKANGAGKTAALGFCMGGALTIIAAVHVPEVDAAVCFYGIPPEHAASPRDVRVPFLAHFATDDEWCNPAAVDAVEAKLREGNVRYELYRYDAKHAFCNDARPQVFDAACAKSAWERTYAFLAKNLR